MERSLKKLIYFDNHTVTKPCKESITAYTNSLTHNWGILGGHNQLSFDLEIQYQKAVTVIKNAFNSDDQWELALNSSYHALIQNMLIGLYSDVVCQSGKNHILTTKHQNALHLFSPLSEQLFLHQLDVEDIIKKIGPRTALVSIPFACITGVLTPVEIIARKCLENGSLLHIDMSLAVGKSILDVQSLNADLITFDGSLFSAPIGTVGLLYKKMTLPSLNFKRCEFSNAAANALAAALKISQEQCDLTMMETARLSAKLSDGICSKLADVQPLFLRNDRLPNTCCLAFPNIHNELLLFALNRQNLLASIPHPSLFNNHPLAKNIVIFALSRDTTDEDIDEAIDRIVFVKNQYKQLWVE
ncbi:MAG: aminotransferase class V-fold PLP-dependent enzyme [Parachlamydiales bacterium]|nr:aminotransferase class V-fold PLP-dependent enzyme [Parachlamydiales bacterium]